MRSSFNNNNNKNNKNNNKKMKNQKNYSNLKKLIKPLYPSKKPKSSIHNLPTERRQRFSHLLLEHGERHLQDWAVTACSSCCAAPSSSSNGKKSKTPENRMYTGRSSSVGSVAMNRNNVQMLNKKGNDKSGASPSGNMGRIEGRLRLCSRSVVFEPNDITRGIIRCPIHKMEASPYVADSTSVEMKCNRHYTMKVNNIIAPYEVVDIPTRIRFTFLHSNPLQFLGLVQTIYNLVKGNLGRQSIPEVVITALDEMIKPMLDQPFDPSNFIDIVNEKPLTSNLRCSIQTPLLSKPGCALVTKERFYFQPADCISSASASKAMYWNINIELVGVARRYYGLKDDSLEMFLEDGTSVLLSFESREERELVIHLLPLDDIVCYTDREFVTEVVHAWTRGEVSNFDYLLVLNAAAGRTYHDLSRYPVFPWVISDYSSSKLDLTNPAVFRDLTKPIGALDDKRLQYFVERMEGITADMDDSATTPFLYGTHYSAPGYVLYYLIRSMPEHMLCLQNGKFDTPDRMFHSIKSSHASILINHADVKELIPEFYDPQPSGASFDFLINASGLQLGTTQNGERVNDVNLPPWAKSPRDLLKKNTKALESSICTSMLPHWIDLIFGYTSRGEEAKKADNLFHAMAYLTPKDLEHDSKMTEDEKRQAELQATEFGIVPDLLFVSPHPFRGDALVSIDTIVIPMLGLCGTPSSYPTLEELSSLQLIGNNGAVDQNEVDGERNHHKNCDQPWELLDRQASHDSLDGVLIKPPSSITTDSKKHITIQIHPSTVLSSSSTTMNNQPRDFGVFDVAAKDSSAAKSFPLSSNRSKSHNQNHLLPERKSISKNNTPKQIYNNNNTLNNHTNGSCNYPPDTTNITAPDIKTVSTKVIHGDSISSCHLLKNYNKDQQQPTSSYYLTTVSLNGELKVHVVTTTSIYDHRRSFFKLSNTNIHPSSQTTTTKLELFRCHKSNDPRTCLTVASDDLYGNVIFTGGHDDLILAYGITSACTVSTIYSHRDAVTDLNLLSLPNNTNPKYTHVLVSGSWDATVKVWAVNISPKENVHVKKEPLIEFYDADSSISCIATTTTMETSIGSSIAISAGCVDGSIFIWLYSWNGEKKLLYKEYPKKKIDSCTTMKWSCSSAEQQPNILYVGFSNGTILSYTISNTFQYVNLSSRLSLGSPVRCLEILQSQNKIYVGCSDGGLRIVTLAEGTFFETSPQIIHPIGSSNSSTTNHSYGITCINLIEEDTNEENVLHVAIGKEDGSIVLLDIR